MLQCGVFFIVLDAKSLTALVLQLPFSDLGSGWRGLALICLASHNNVKLSQEQIGSAFKNSTTAINHEGNFPCSVSIPSSVISFH